MKMFDALIVGAGPAGCTAALVLARAGWRVAVVEKASFPRRKVCGEYVSPASWPLLHALGVAPALLERAGPAIRHVGLYAGETVLAADMPRAREETAQWGRALGREHLDTMLLEHASRAGAEVFQPWVASRLERTPRGFACDGLQARMVIAAHGSWETGTLPTQEPRRSALPADLLGFKAHFRDAPLPSSLMPLILFPGGYGGLVHTDGGRVSLSCCIRRDALERARRARGNARAGEALQAHVAESCRGVREALRGATREGPWLSAGPVRPGFRNGPESGAGPASGIFRIGNAAGEAHPIVAEGIGMAIQSAVLLTGILISRRESAEREYERAWRDNFVPRVRAAALFARLMTNPAGASASVALLKAFPAILTLGARWSGKDRKLSLSGDSR
jgi:flavin-dependent dehydrogenase